MCSLTFRTHCLLILVSVCLRLKRPQQNAQCTSNQSACAVNAACQKLFCIFDSWPAVFHVTSPTNWQLGKAHARTYLWDTYFSSQFSHTVCAFFFYLIVNILFAPFRRYVCRQMLGELHFYERDLANSAAAAAALHPHWTKWQTRRRRRFTRTFSRKQHNWANASESFSMMAQMPCQPESHSGQGRHATRSFRYVNCYCPICRPMSTKQMPSAIRWLAKLHEKR